jgi:hypothetical protein
MGASRAARIPSGSALWSIPMGEYSLRSDTRGHCSPETTPRAVEDERPEEGTALLRGAIEVGAQGVLGEVLFPQPGCEEVDFQGGMRIDTL